MNKLKEFTARYYTKKVIRGLLLFLSVGIVFWILVTFLEHMLWLDPQWRLILFVCFLVVEGLLLYGFVMVPVAMLLGLRNQIDNKDAAVIIAKHFPDVGDHLYNLLDLSDNKESTELLLASIEQRAKKLKWVPFAEAARVIDGFKHAKYLVLPLGILLIVWIAGDISLLFSSHTRLVNHDMVYEKPAPFKFVVLNDSLSILDTQPLEVKIAVVGDSRPEQVSMVVD